MRSKRSLALLCAAALLFGGLAAHPMLFGQTDGVDKTHAVPKDLVSYRDVVKKVLPAVVSVRVTAREKTDKVVSSKPKTDDSMQEVPFQFNGDADEGMRKFMEEFMRRRGGSMMPDQTPDPRGHFGSGVIVDPKGIIITNRHVVAGAGAVEVALQDGRKFTSKMFVQDPKTDLAVVKLDGVSGLPFVELGDSDAMEIGDRVLAIGAPYGLAGSVSAGIVSGKGRNLYMNMYEDFLQTDAAINPGNSGGPLVNLAGQVIGINTAIKTQNGGFQGIGLAIPSSIVKEVVWQMARDGSIKRGYLGAEIGQLQPGVAAKLHLDANHAVEIGKVRANTPGAKAGLKEGDIILNVAGQPVGDVKSLQRSIRTAPLGKPLAFGVYRDGKKETINVTIEQQPEDYGLVRETMDFQRPNKKRSAPETMAVDKLGIQVTDLTPETASQFGYADAKGVVITEVNEDGAAAEAGLRRGMLIVQAEKKPVESAAALKEALSSASLKDGVLLMVRTPQGGTHRVLVQQSGE